MPITVSDVPVISASQDTLVDAGSSIELSASTTLGDLNWTWTPNTQGDILACLNNDCTLVEVSPLISTVFTVTASSTAGCEVSEQIAVLLNVSDGIGVPNTFSPNGDGLNDLLFVKGQNIVEMDFKVFNRFGELVFETNDQSIGWDGNFRLKEEKDASFAWMLRYELLDGRSGDMNGNVTIVR
jgi:gliding motility-associated-like protein